MIKNDDSPTNSQIMTDRNINENSLIGVDNIELNNNNESNESNNENSYLFPLDNNKENMGTYIIGSTIPLIKEQHQLEKQQQQQQQDQKVSPALSSTSSKKLKSKYKDSPPLLSSINDGGDDYLDSTTTAIPQTFDLDTEIPRATITSVTASPTTSSIKNIMKSKNKVEKQQQQQQENNLEENNGDDMLLIDRMIGYQSSVSRELLYWVSVIFTGGLSLLIYYWFELLYINIRFIKLDNLCDATHVLVYSQDSRFEFCKVNHLKDEKYLIYRFSRFFFNEQIQEFEKSKINSLYEKSKLLNLIDCGLDDSSYDELKQRFGKNEINFPVKNIPRLLMEEVLHPFFIFQIYSVCLWMAEEYYYYAVAIFIIATVSAVVSLREVRSNLLSLQKISHFTCDVNVLRSSSNGNNGIVQTISSTELVPGDIIELSQDFIMPCDVILLSGQAILNESMLTGESIPVNKYSVLSDDDIKFQKQQKSLGGGYNNNHMMVIGDNNSNNSSNFGGGGGFEDEIKDLSKEKRSLVYGGTVVVKLLSTSVNGKNDKVLGMVRDTSFQTTKGKLILSILFPKKSHFKFFVESLKFVGVLCCLALVGFSLSVWRLKTLGESFHIIALRALDLITIVIPPALPMAMTVGTGFGLNRLRKSKIFCISPPRLNMAGKIQVFCFDKTGTLTEEGLDLLGILSTTPISSYNSNGVGGVDTSNNFLSNSHQSSIHNKSMSIPTSPSISSRSSDAIHNSGGVGGHMLFSLTSSTPSTPNIQSANQLMVHQLISNNGYTFDEMNDPNQSLFNSNQNIFRILMASCHSLSVINGAVSGDPLEIKIFESTKSTIIDGDNNGSGQTIQLSADKGTSQEGTSISYLENFDFQSKLQRMSVIVQLQSNSTCYSLVKGSPEMIKNLCIPITLPKDYDSKLAIYTEKGYRVLACAYKPWDPTVIYPKRDILRKESESNLQFIGFIIMENRIKPQSPGIIDTLQKANIRTIMVTGDNGLTATSVAKQCGIIKKTSLLYIGLIQQSTTTTTSGSNEQQQQQEIVWELVSQEGGKDVDQQNSIYQLDPTTLLLDDPNRDYNLIITGPVFKQIYANYLATGSERFVNMLRRGVVYARMTPDEKQSLVEELERVGLYVGMCGDGANDCGALKAAHVGISLSESEASIAAPFTSTITDISCCPTLIKEGRASLAVSFKLFQFMGMYSLIQFTSVIFLYFHASVLGNWQYLYQDLIVIFPLVIFLGMTQPCNKLSIKRPSGRLMSGAIIGSLFAHIIVCVSFQIALYLLVQAQSWYDAPELDDQNIRHYITTTLFIVGSFQYSIMLLTFSFGKPFLKQLYTNRYLFIVYLITLTTNFILLFGGWFNLSDFLQLRVLPVSWRFTIFGFLAANLIVNVLVEFSFYLYKLRSKKKKVLNITKIFTKDQNQIPIDNRISENSILIPIHNKKHHHHD